MPTKKSKRRYNWIPDLPDQRDFLYKVAAPTTPPKSVDLRAKCSPVFDQGKIGSCTGNALAGGVEFLELVEMKTSGKGADVFDPKKFQPVSRLFIYYNERDLEGTTDQDAGAMLRDGVKSLVNEGVCRELTWKYSPTLVLKKPTAKAYKEAADHELTSYLRIQTLEQMKQCLAQGYPFALGFSVYESFESPAVAANGRMPMPQASERLLGGHAVLAVGYDDAQGVLIVRNSWGVAWGDRGYFYMPYAYVQSAKLAQDFWTLRK